MPETVKVVNEMKTYFALLLCSLAFVFAVAGQSIDKDPKFLVLLNWTKEIAEKSYNWNNHCGGKTEPGCAEFRQMLVGQMNAFIDMALTYKVEGSDCTARLRARTIGHEIQLHQWNIRCGGITATDKCRGEGAHIVEEEAAITADIKACLDSEHDINL